MSRWRWALLCGLCSAMLTVLLLAVDGRQQRGDLRAELGYGSDLRRLEALAAALDRELLRCRAGLTPHYDDLGRVFTELRQLQDRLLRAPAGLGFMPGPDLSAALLRVSSLSREQGQWLARFESENRLLLESRRALPALLERLRARLPGLPGSEQAAARLTSLLVALSHLDMAPLPDALLRLNAALDALELALPAAAGWRADALPVLHHGRAIAQRTPLVEQLSMQLLNLPLAGAVQSVVAAHQHGQREALSRGQLRNGLSTGFLALAGLLGLVLVSLQLRDDKRAAAVPSCRCRAPSERWTR